MRNPVEAKIGKDAVLRGMKMLARREVLVGIPASAGSADGAPITLAEIGYLMETGSPANNTPARPWLVSGIEDAEKKFLPHLKKAARAALLGDAAGMEDALTSAGLIAQASVLAKLDSNVGPPLSPRTLRARKTRKDRPNTRENTLVDKRDMRMAVQMVIADVPDSPRKRRR